MRFAWPWSPARSPGHILLFATDGFDFDCKFGSFAELVNEDAAIGRLNNSRAIGNIGAPRWRLGLKRASALAFRRQLGLKASFVAPHIWSVQASTSRATARRMGTSLAGVLAAVTAIFLHRRAAMDDVIIALPLACP